MALDLDRRYFVPEVLPEAELYPPVSEPFAQHVIYEGRQSNGELVVLTPAWHNGQPQYGEFAHRIAASGKTVCAFYFGNDILSADVERTLVNHRRAGEHVVNEVTALQKAGGFRSTHLVTSSLGGITGMWAVENGLQIDKLTTVTFGDTLADCIIEGIRTQHLWEVMQAAGCTVAELRKDLRELAPANNVRNLKGKHVTGYLSPADNVIPHHRGKLLLEAFSNADAKLHVRNIPLLGHYSLLGLYYKFGRP